MARRRKRPIVGVNDVLVGAFEAHGLTDQARRLRITLAWEQAVGPQIAQRTQPDSFRRGVLLVRVRNATWQNELTFLKAEILGKLNAHLGSEVVRDLKVVAGAVHTLARDEKPKPWLSEPERPEDQVEAHRVSEGIVDDEVRERFEKLLRLDLRARRQRGQ